LNNKNSAYVLFIITLISISNIQAQVLPGSIEPGRIEKGFEKPIEPKSQLEIKIPEKVEQVPPEQADKIRFNLVGITLQGNTVYEDDKLFSLWEKLLGTEVSLTQIYKVADAITAYYRNAGYILTQAIVPPQKITNGIVIIKVIEGYANEVFIEGDVQWRNDLFNGWIRKIKGSKPLNNAVLERYTLLGSDLPGTTVKSIIRPSKTVSGASDVVLMIERKLVDASVTYDNLGTRTIGKDQLNVNIGLNSLLNLFERTNLTYLTSGDAEELKYFGFQHNHTLTAEGLNFSFNGNISYSKPGESLKQLEIESENMTLNFLFSYPLIRSRNENLSLQTGLTARDSKTDILGQLSSEDRLRVLKIGVNYDYSDTWQGVNLINFMFYQGLDIFNSTKTGSSNLTRADGHNEFTKLTLDISRRQTLPKNFSLLLAGTGQLSDVSLLSSEEFGYGGSQYGRAYYSSSITGDNGVAGKAELQYTGNVDAPFTNYYQVYSFYDIGATFSNSKLKSDKDYGSSVGGGVRFGLTDYFSSYLEIAQPLTPHISTMNSRDNYPRFFFNVVAKY
jgi:hemolysin activation/secretion protein